MQFSIYQESRRGARKVNQDRIACCYSREALLLLVADGLGGHAHGEIAAQTAMLSITAAFRREARPSLADPRSFLRQAMDAAHRTIVHDAAVGGLAETPRTTCVACIVQHGAASWAHAGDSRLYHIRDGRILTQTRDHSFVQQLIDRGRMREEAGAAHPARNQIFSCLGSNGPPRVDLSQATPLVTGDILILCSDGFWSPLSKKIISSAVLKGGIMQAAPELLDEAERRAGDGCDNLSVVAVNWVGQGAATRAGGPPARNKPPELAATPPQAGGAAKTQSACRSDAEIEGTVARMHNAPKRQLDDQT